MTRTYLTPSAIVLAGIVIAGTIAFILRYDNLGNGGQSGGHIVFDRWHRDFIVCAPHLAGFGEGGRAYSIYTCQRQPLASEITPPPDVIEKLLAAPPRPSTPSQ